MKKIIIFLLLFAGVLQAGAERVERYNTPRIFWDTSTRKTIFSDGNYARLIDLQDGRLMAVASQAGNIVGSFSGDKGSSWGSPFTIATSHDNINMCVPDLIQLRDGTIIVAYNPRPVKPYTEDRKFGIRCKRSTDNGATWSEEIFVNDATHDFYNGCWEPSMLELPSGELHLYFADEGPYPSVGYGDQQISLCRSFDGGKSWTEKQKVSYRAGFRDGMPVPILLDDKSEIVVAIEDNGWGYGDFFPTTVRCPLSDDWGNDYFVDASSSNRDKTLNSHYCPAVTGGAPYLRKLAGGGTVLSWQSAYGNNGVFKMWTAVGNSEARDFKALSQPFITTATEGVMWNSVAVVDTVVYAVGGVGRAIEMEKGYPKKQFEASYGTPSVDGMITRNEGYYTPDGVQFGLGGETSTVALCDFAYDRDSLYFLCCVSDTCLISAGAYQDCVRLYVDAKDTSDTRPTEGVYEYTFCLTGQVMRCCGDGMGWRYEETAGPRCVVKLSDSFYVVEASLPWSDMGLAAVPASNIAVNVEVQNWLPLSRATESIPDADGNAPYTWMPLHLQDAAEL